MSWSPFAKRVIQITILTVVYVGAGRAGLALPYVGSNITLLWPPTGIALAAMFRWGPGCWPGVFFGATLVNLWVGSSGPVAIGIAVGNTLGPVFAALALRRLGFDERIERHRDALLFLFVSAVTMMIPAAGGTTSLLIGGGLPRAAFADAWRMWWLGDAMGALLFAPLLLTASKRWLDHLRNHFLEFAGLYMATLATSWWVFFRSRSEMNQALPLEFLTMPAVVWAALRFEAFGASIVSISLLVIAACATALGHGPFYHQDLHQGLLLLWAFIGTTGLIAFAITPLQAERLRAGEALQESEARFRTVLETIKEVVWVARPGKIEPTYLSPSFERIWGQPISSFDSRPTQFLETIHPDDRNVFLEALERQKSGEPTSIEYRIARPDGSWRWIWDQGFPIYNAARQLTAVNGIASDITERRQAELALEEQRQRLSGIIHSALDGIITINEEQLILVFNPAAERMFEYPPSEVMGKPISQILNQCEPLKEEMNISTQPEPALAKPNPGHIGKAIGIRRSREEFPIELSVSQILVDGRRLFTLTCRDITERVRSEQRRALLESQLQQAQKMDALGTLAGGIAHDFNNILAVIIGQSDISVDNPKDTAMAVESLEEIGRAARRARDLVHQILTFSRQQPQERTVTSLVPVTEETVRFLRVTLPAHIELRTEISPDTPNVMADSTSIHQILINLCTNAWHALEDRPGWIEIRLTLAVLDMDQAAKLRGVRPGQFACLSVTDSGKGIPPEIKTRIFEPFFTTKEPGKGTGLGLSVVHGIVQNHEGAITVETGVGAGSVFRLYFPAVESVEEPNLPRGAKLPLGRGQRVMYVDDEASLVSVASRMLSRLGYEVRGFTQPAEALSALRQAPGEFDALISDLNMPLMSGMDLLREASLISPATTLLLSSGYINEDLLDQAKQLGIRQVLYKPTTLAELAEELRKAFSRQGTTEDPSRHYIGEDLR